MTREQLKRVHMALEQHGGKISPAATLLGISPDSLKRIIRDEPELRSYLKDAQPPEEAETLARPAVPAITAKDEALVRAVRAADSQLRDSFEATGIKGESLEQAMAFRQLGQLHFSGIREFVGGGVAKLFADLMADIKDTRKEIEKTSLDDPELQKVLREDRSRLVKMALDTYDRVRQATTDAAMIEAKKQEMKQAGKKGKPGFTPLGVAMNVNGNVTVQEAPAPKPEQVPVEA
jgi:hypothetical protein